MNAPNIPALIADIKKPLDEARAVADKIDATINGLSTNFLGKIIDHLPGVGDWIAAGTTAAAALDALIDALDGVVDAYSAPATTAATTTLPQASVAGDTTIAVK